MSISCHLSLPSYFCFLLSFVFFFFSIGKRQCEEHHEDSWERKGDRGIRGQEDRWADRWVVLHDLHTSVPALCCVIQFTSAPGWWRTLTSFTPVTCHSDANSWWESFYPPSVAHSIWQCAHILILSYLIQSSPRQSGYCWTCWVESRWRHQIYGEPCQRSQR